MRDDEPLRAGQSAFVQGRFHEALECFGRALAAAPHDPNAINNFSGALLALSRNEEALNWLQRALSIDPAHLQARSNLGVALGSLHRHPQAIAAFREVLGRDPGNLDVLNNLGFSLMAMGSQAEALRCFSAVVERQPGHVEALKNKAIALTAFRRFDEALALLDRVDELFPRFAAAELARSYILLKFGRLKEGFSLYECRWRTRTLRHAMIDSDKPRWDGRRDVAGRRILLWAEQGLGDAIQFMRYVDFVSRLGASVTLRVPASLVALARTMPGACEVVAEEGAIPEHELHCPLMSLPRIFGTELATVPSSVPYLAADPELASKWAARLAGLGHPRVGLVWAGRQTPPVNHARDIPLRLFEPLLGMQASFVSLQKVVPEAERTLFASLRNGGLLDLGEELGDLAETAAAVANLDLLICVDTSVAHLAGAMGRPVWILNRYNAEWRWMLDRADSPWYPTARLFRQPRMNDWQAVIDEVCTALGAGLPDARTGDV